MSPAITRNRSLSAFVFLSTIAVLISGCLFVKPIYFDDDKKVAMGHADKLHQFYRDKKFADMIQLFHAESDFAKNPETYTQRLEAMYQYAGKLESSALVKSDVKVQGPYRLVHLIYRSEYEYKILMEVFDCLVNDKDAVFVGYAALTPDEYKNLPQ